MFEHLDDWRRGLDAAMALLAPGGRHVILCPNHALPYESHFNIPLIGGPGLSRRLFARRIARIEAENDAEGIEHHVSEKTLEAFAQFLETRRRTKERE